MLVAYVVGADCTLAKDGGDGWKILDAVYDTVNGFGALIAAMNSWKNGSITGAGIILPGSAAWTSQCITYNARSTNGVSIQAPMRYDVAAATGSVGGITDAASSATVNIPGILPSYSQWLEVVAGGYNNAGTTTTIATLNPGLGFGYLECIDTGQVAPQHGVWMDTSQEITDPRQAQQFMPAITGTLAVAKTNRASVRACIPVTGNVNAGAMRQRMMGARRFG